MQNCPFGEGAAALPGSPSHRAATPVATESHSSSESSTPPPTVVADDGQVQELSSELRAETAELHREVERRLNLPDAIGKNDDYRRWLIGFLGFYQPLEARLMSFSEWDRFGISLASRLHTPSLVHDLSALGMVLETPPVATAEHLPELPTVSHALGALYVIEGATLGGRIILHAVEARPGISIGRARQFFGGRDRDTGRMWNEFRRCLDGFGRTYPDRRGDVVEGARQTFQALMAWFGPNDGGERAHER